MSFNIPNEVKAQMLQERIKALNVEGYQHELNKKAAEAIGNQDVVWSSEDAIKIIKSAIEVHEKELSELE